MHGIKDPDLKEMTEATNEEEAEIKEDTKVKHCTCSLYSEVVLACFCHFFFFAFKFFYGYTVLKIQTVPKTLK